MNTSLVFRELIFRTSRSGGKGGQNVNKVETKVEVIFFPVKSAALSEDEKNILLERLKNRLRADGSLSIVSSKHRSQLENKADAKQKLIALIERALLPVKKRKKTKISAAKKKSRLESKRKHSEKKAARKLPPLSEV